MTTEAKKLIKLQIEEKVKEMIRIHTNTLWYGISEKKSTILGERIEVLDKEIENLRDSIA